MAYRSVLRSLLTAMGIVLLANRLQKARSRMAESERRAASGAAEARRSEEHTSELQSLMRISYAVFCLKKKKNMKDKMASVCKRYSTEDTSSARIELRRTTKHIHLEQE